MPRPLHDAVVVVTGASSGIGRATAQAFANRGSAVVVAARRDEALDEVVVECERAGGRALAVPTDVTDFAAVQALARRAVETFGRIDVWVNNAAVTLFGRFEETPLEDFKRVFETDVFGYVHGARAALPIFREQGGGVLINVASVVASVPQPYTTPYVMSKHAIRALGMSLRQELSLDGAKDVHVCTVLPATIDTPLFQEAANYTGRAAKAMPPVYPPEQVAETIVRLARHPEREVTVGRVTPLAMLTRTLAPGLTEKMMARQVEKSHLDPSRPAPPTSGNLREPMPQYATVTGGWRADGNGQGRQLALGLVAAVPALAALRWARRRDDRRRRRTGLRGLLAR